MTAASNLVARLLGRSARRRLARVVAPLAIVALLAAAGVVAAAVLLTSVRISLPWHDRYVTSVAVRDAQGVTPGTSSVRIAGVTVGVVSDVSVDGGVAVLRLEIDEDRAPLYRDARVTVRPTTPLNDMYVDVVDRGTRAAGPLGEDDTLSALNVATSVNIGRILNVFDADTRPRVRAAIIETAQALKDRGDDFVRALQELAPFLREVRRLSDQIALRAQRTKRVVRNFGQVQAELARRERQLRRLVTAAGQTFTVLGDRSADVEALYRELPATLRSVPESLGELRRAAKAFTPTLVSLRPVARSLPDGLRSLRRLSPALLTSSRAMKEAVRPLDRLLRVSPKVTGPLAPAYRDTLSTSPGLERVARRTARCQDRVTAYLKQYLSVFKIGTPLSVIDHTLATVPLPTLKLTKLPSCLDKAEGSAP